MSEKSKPNMTSSYKGWEGAPMYCLYCKSGMYEPELGDENVFLICGSCGDGYSKKEHELEKLMSSYSASSIDAKSCNCIGPQNGEPKCPCVMESKKIRKIGNRWVQPEQDLGPVSPEAKEIF